MTKKKSARSIMKIRSAGVLLLVSVFLLYIVFNLSKIMIFDYKFYQEKAIEQQTRDTIITPKRGTIYDTKMKKLAVSATVETVVISPRDIKSEADRKLIATGLSEILGISYDEIITKSNKDNYHQVIKRKIDKDVADAVRQFKTDNKLDAIQLMEDTKRFYPYAAFASHVIGFTDVDNVGTYGIEGFYNDHLTGVAGRVITIKDAAGKAMPFQYSDYYDPQNGQNVVLTLDEGVQHYLEKHLESALLDNDCDYRVTGIVMDVKTGGILAMATLPDFDPNDKNTILDPKVQKELSKVPEADRATATNQAIYDTWRNKAIVDAYDPGSTFKILTAAMGLEDGVVKTSDQFTCGGSATVSGRAIRCWKAGGHGHEDFTKGVQNSCNPVFMEVGRRIGLDRFYNYMSLMGMRDLTGIDLPGESKGVFHSRDNFRELELATASFGQNFSITPIQLITAVSAVANGGQYITPHLIKGIADDDENMISTYKPEVKKQIISAQTSKLLCEILESVVTDGSGGGAYVKGYRVAGKTGTSEKIAKQLKTGKDNLRIASFVGFAPADDPQVAVLVMLDEPNGPIKFGGVIAAPVVGRIMSDILPYLGVEPQYTQEEAETLSILVPNVLRMEKGEAIAKLKATGFKYRIIGEGSVVTDQLPIPGVKIPASAEITVYCGEEKVTEDIVVPSFNNMSISQVLQTGAQAGLYINTRGSLGGSSKNKQIVAKYQDPAAGTTVKSGTVITVEFVDLSQAD